MLRMEIALIIILAFVALLYFSAEGKYTALQKTFALLINVMIIHLTFDAITIYTVNHLDTVPRIINDIAHRLFIGSMVLTMFLFYQYIAILVEEETGNTRYFDLTAKALLGILELCVVFFPIQYKATPQGNYSVGLCVYICYLSMAVYLLFYIFLLVKNWRFINYKKRFAISVATIIALCVTILQAINPLWLISSMGFTLMTLSFYLTLENPDILRAELIEQKMSMLYLKSQINHIFFIIH